MRTIKFRGKGDNNEWVYGDLIQEHLGDGGDVMVMYILGNYWYDAMSEMVEVQPGTVGQFTGLSDSKGKDIYEGDILTGNYLVVLRMVPLAGLMYQTISFLLPRLLLIIMAL